MSMMLMVQALKAKVGSPLRKLVLVKLADQANDDGECWPSYQSIAEACEMSRRTVISHIEWLEENGFLRRNYRKSKEGLSRSNVFVLTIENGANTAPQGANNSPRGANAAPPSGENFAPGGANAAPIETVNESISFESVNESGGAPTRDPDQPSRDTPPEIPDPPPESPPRAKPKRQSREEAFVAFVVERGVDEETARCWWQYRDGKPMTSKAWERHCAQAEAAGITPQAAADYTAGRGWAGFYANSYLREMEELAQIRQRRSAPQGRVFDQAGIPQGGIVPAGMPQGRTSQMSKGLAIIEKFKKGGRS